MEIVDLSHLLEEGMTVYPGTESPSFVTACTLAKDKFKETRLTMFSHVGTHIDCPAHIFEAGQSTDNMPLTQFFGNGVVIDCTHLSEGERVELTDLVHCKEKLKEAEFVLFYTGWSKKWGTPEYFGNFPTISLDVARFFIKMKIKGVGFDTISIDPVASSQLETHHLVLSHEMIIIENLNNLDLLLEKPFKLACFPLKIKEGDGSPVRAVAILDCEIK